jgi:hypothetical protein
MTKYYYTVNEKLDDPEDRYEFVTSFTFVEPDDLDTLAETIADYDWGHNDGFEYSWPVEYYLWDKDHNYLGSYEVHMDMHPTFTAYELKYDREKKDE